MAKKIPPIDNEEQQRLSIKTFAGFIESTEPWEELTHSQYAKNTLVAFKNDWNSFVVFCIENQVPCLPAKSDTVHRYIDQMSRSRKLASLKRYMVTISLVHRCHNLTDPAPTPKYALRCKSSNSESMTITVMLQRLEMNTYKSFSINLSFPPK